MENINLTTLDSPKVKIFYHPRAKTDGQLLEIKYGIEEEGIPFSCEAKTEFPSIQEMAFAAAEASILGVGLGIAEDKTVALHYHRLRPNLPLFTLLGNTYTPDLGRIMGSNAARLVKGNSFKPLRAVEESRTAPNNTNKKKQDSKAGQEEMVQLITRMVCQTLQERRG